jgi:hypothetical protein
MGLFVTLYVLQGVCSWYTPVADAPLVAVNTSTCNSNPPLVLLLLLLQVWYLAGTLVLVNAIACVVVVLVAALITPTHASEEVRPCHNVLLC